MSYDTWIHVYWVYLKPSVSNLFEFTMSPNNYVQVKSESFCLAMFNKLKIFKELGWYMYVKGTGFRY